jgi:hypothetical protein
MDEATFWDVVGRAQGSADEVAIHRIWLRLRQCEPSEILAFEERLAEVLHRMDLRPVARQRWRDVAEPAWLPRIPGISADGFLYARCAAVLEGADEVAAIVADPRRFKRRWDLGAERLLSVASDAWEARTGRAWDHSHQTAVSYETASNPAGGWD